MNTKNLSNFICLSFVLLLISCNKTIDKSIWKAEINNNKFHSLQELFSQVGPESLIDVIESKDIAKAENFNKAKADQIASYFHDKYNLDISEKFIDNPEGIVILGMFYAEKEYQDARLKIKGNSLLYMKTPDENMNCVMSVVTGILSLGDVKSIWNALSAGATEETVIAAAKLIGKRVAIAASVTYMVYQIGDCLEWW